MIDFRFFGLSGPTSETAGRRDGATAEEFSYDLRIGGAIDLRLQRGLDAGRALLRERGRWAKDIGFIYAHSSAREHSAASGDMSTPAARAFAQLGRGGGSHAPVVPQLGYTAPRW